MQYFAENLPRHSKVTTILLAAVEFAQWRTDLDTAFFEFPIGRGVIPKARAFTSGPRDLRAKCSQFRPPSVAPKDPSLQLKAATFKMTPG